MKQGSEQFNLVANKDNNNNDQKDNAENSRTQPKQAKTLF